MKQLSLDGNWQFAAADRENWLPAAVPGCVHLDLIAQGALPDPFFGLAERAAYQLEAKGWRYRRAFTLEAVPREQVDLVCEGLDTLCELYLNGKFLGTAENMFISHRYAVKEYLQAGVNTVEIRFAAASVYGKNQKRNASLDLAGNEAVFLRKAQCSFGWDWGPRLVQTGIWRPIYLEAYQARLANPAARLLSLAAGEATVEIVVEIAGTVRQASVLATIKEEAGAPVATGALTVVNQAGRLTASGKLKLREPKLWYPAGYGSQPLYRVELALREGEEKLAEAAFVTGLRTLELLREKDAQGESFIFVINGLKVFAKGANWIPADVFLPRVTADAYERYIKLAREANMNMLRVWGGGVYEDPAFYEACDRAGLMVWQDFMYACAEYPDHLAAFRQAATEEAREAVLRLRNHPSLVLWCGNNENSWGLKDWWHRGEPEYRGNYLYRQAFPEVVSVLDPTRPYWTGSPWGGASPNSPDFGDQHMWDVWGGWKEIEQYAKYQGRFVSEFGFQALPAYKTVLSYTAPEDRKLFSPVCLSHNKAAQGTERLLKYLAENLGLPRDYRSFVYLTQFNQALALKLAVEAWRGRKFSTAGALIWQLNDCWPVSSWSLVDYYGRKKAAWWWSRSFFAPLLVNLEPGKTGVGVRVVSDCPEKRTGSVRLACYSLAGEKRGGVEFEVAIPANASTLLETIPYEALGIKLDGEGAPVIKENGLTQIVDSVSRELAESVIFAELESGQRYRNHLAFAKLRDLPLADPQIALRVEGKRITLRAKTPAFGVFLEPERDVDLSSNCLVMEPDAEYVVSCSEEPGGVEVFDLTKMRLDV